MQDTLTVRRCHAIEDGIADVELYDSQSNLNTAQKEYIALLLEDDFSDWMRMEQCNDLQTVLQQVELINRGLIEEREYSAERYSILSRMIYHPESLNGIETLNNTAVTVADIIRFSLYYVDYRIKTLSGLDSIDGWDVKHWLDKFVQNNENANAELKTELPPLTPHEQFIVSVSPYMRLFHEDEVRTTMMTIKSSMELMGGYSGSALSLLRDSMLGVYVSSDSMLTYADYFKGVYGLLVEHGSTNVEIHNEICQGMEGIFTNKLSKLEYVLPCYAEYMLWKRMNKIAIIGEKINDIISNMPDVERNGGDMPRVINDLHVLQAFSKKINTTRYAMVWHHRILQLVMGYYLIIKMRNNDRCGNLMRVAGMSFCYYNDELVQLGASILQGDLSYNTIGISCLVTVVSLYNAVFNMAYIFDEEGKYVLIKIVEMYAVYNTFQQCLLDESQEIIS